MSISSNDNSLETLAQLLKTLPQAQNNTNNPSDNDYILFANSNIIPATQAHDYTPFAQVAQQMVIPNDYQTFDSKQVDTNEPEIGPWHWVRISIATICIIIFGILFVSYYWAQQITSYGPPRTVWQTKLIGHEFGIDSWPVSEYNSGYLEIWHRPNKTSDYQPIFRFPGKPAKPAPRRLQPGEVLAYQQINAPTHHELERLFCREA